MLRRLSYINVTLPQEPSHTFSSSSHAPFPRSESLARVPSHARTHTLSVGATAVIAFALNQTSPLPPPLFGGEHVLCQSTCVLLVLHILHQRTPIDHRVNVLLPYDGERLTFCGVDGVGHWRWGPSPTCDEHLRRECVLFIGTRLSNLYTE